LPGPHTATICRRRRLAAKLAALTAQLRESANNQKFTVDWSQFEKLCADAAKAKSVGDFAGASRGYCFAINSVMAEFANAASSPSRPTSWTKLSATPSPSGFD
jgi:hypothetical protein